MNYIDPDGESWVDVVVGYLVGTATNLIPGTERLRDFYSPTALADYNSALRISDNIAVAAGSTLVIAGKGGIAGAEVFAIGTSSTATGFMLMANSAENMNGGYERGNTSTGNKNSKHANLNAKGNLNNISMNTFTFITEYIGGTYISQFESLEIIWSFLKMLIIL